MYPRATSSVGNRYDSGIWLQQGLISDQSINKSFLENALKIRAADSVLEYLMALTRLPILVCMHVLAQSVRQ